MSEKRRVNISLSEDVWENAKAYVSENDQYTTLSGFISKAISAEMNAYIFRVSKEIYKRVTERAVEWDMKAEDLISEALEDALADNRVTLTVSENTKQTYHKMFTFEGVSDKDFEPYFKKAVAQYMEDKIIGRLKDEE